MYPGVGTFVLLRPAQTFCERIKLVTNDEELIEDDKLQIFKLWPTRGDREAFRHAMDNGLASNDFAESLIVRAHEFFKLQAHKWLQDASGPIESRIDALEAAATSMLQMVVIDLDSQDCQGRREIRPCGGAKVYHSGLDVQRKCPPTTGVVGSP